MLLVEKQLTGCDILECYVISIDGEEYPHHSHRSESQQHVLRSNVWEHSVWRTSLKYQASCEQEDESLQLQQGWSW